MKNQTILQKKYNKHGNNEDSNNLNLNCQKGQLTCLYAELSLSIIVSSIVCRLIRLSVVDKFFSLRSSLKVSNALRIVESSRAMANRKAAKERERSVYERRLQEKMR